MTSTERIIEGFAHPTITPIVGQPCYETIMPLKLSLSTNAASVNSHLGDGLLGLLWLTVTDAVFNTLSLIPFIPPLNPGPIPIIPAGATQFQITALTDTHKRETVIFQEFNNTDKALKQQLLGAVDDMFTRALKNRYIGYANVTTKQPLAHLFSTYRNITSGDLRQNDIKMNTVYDVNMPIETLFDQVEDGMEYAAAGNNPKTPEKIVLIPYLLHPQLCTPNTLVGILLHPQMCAPNTLVGALWHPHLYAPNTLLGILRSYTS